MIKKKDGYVLVYVVFVIIFLCIVAVGTCTVALNNLKTQTAYIEQMQDRYEAEGNIEQFMAEVCVAANGLSGISYDAQTAFETVVSTHRDGIALSDVHWEGDNRQCTVTATSTAGGSKAIATIAFSLDITYDAVGTGKDENDDGEEDTVVTFTITGVTSKYLSYTLESAGGEAE